jgi:hypothetical protein
MELAISFEVSVAAIPLGHDAAMPLIHSFMLIGEIPLKGFNIAFQRALVVLGRKKSGRLLCALSKRRLSWCVQRVRCCHHPNNFHILKYPAWPLYPSSHSGNLFLRYHDPLWRKNALIKCKDIAPLSVLPIVTSALFAVLFA